MNVNVHLLVEIPRQAKFVRPGTYITERRPGRFLHDVPQLAGEYEVPLTLEDGHLRLEDLSANFGPGKTCCQADPVLLLDDPVLELGDTQEFTDNFG